MPDPKNLEALNSAPESDNATTVSDSPSALASESAVEPAFEPEESFGEIFSQYVKALSFQSSLTP
jgi:hypothetical protein